MGIIKMKSTILALVALAVTSANAAALRKAAEKNDAPKGSSTSTFRGSLETEEMWNRFKGDVENHIKGSNKLRSAREEKVRAYFRRVDAQRATANELKSAEEEHSKKVEARKRADSKVNAAKKH